MTKKKTVNWEDIKDHSTLCSLVQEGDNALIVHHKNTFKKCVDISRAKCQDYAGDQDPLANFRMCQQFGVSLEHGIMVRLSDKISRIGRLLNKENTVLDEKIEDSIEDGIVYLSILLFALKERNEIYKGS